TAARINEAASRSSQIMRYGRPACWRRRSTILRFRYGGAVRRARAIRSSRSKSTISSISSRVAISVSSGSTHILLQVNRGFGPQQLESALQMALHGGQRRAQRGRNLFRRQILLIAENQRRALRLGHGGKQALHAIGQGRGTFFRLRAVGLVDLDPLVNTAHAPPAQGIGGPAHSDAPQPQQRMQRSFDLAQMPVELQKNILRDFFRQAAVAGHAQGERKDHRLVLVDKLLEVGLPGSGHKSLLPSNPQGDAGWDEESYENEPEKF